MKISSCPLTWETSPFLLLLAVKTHWNLSGFQNSCLKLFNHFLTAQLLTWHQFSTEPAAAVPPAGLATPQKLGFLNFLTHFTEITCAQANSSAIFVFTLLYISIFTWERAHICVYSWVTAFFQKLINVCSSPSWGKRKKEKVFFNPLITEVKSCFLANTL